jgi:hypothetical protein
MLEATMTTFDERERAFEKKYSMDQEFKFKAKARRNKLVGEWAAAKLGLSGAAVGNYIKKVVDADVVGAGDGAYRRLKTDLATLGVTNEELQKVMNEFLQTAARQLEAQSK